MTLKIPYLRKTEVLHFWILSIGTGLGSSQESPGEIEGELYEEMHYNNKVRLRMDSSSSISGAEKVSVLLF